MKKLNEDVRVYGLFGFPLAHSLSAEMQNAALCSTGIAGIYFLFERNRKRFLKLIRSRSKMILDGFNVTVPYKEIIVPQLDRLDRDVRLTGAANTVKRTGGRWFGYNTDVYGFEKSLSKLRWRPAGRKIVLLGAGGAARAVLSVLARGRARQIAVMNRHAKRGEYFVRLFQRRFPRVRINRLKHSDDLQVAMQDTDLLVNATSVGLKRRDPLLVPPHFFQKRRKILVYDLIYRPRETRLLKEARRFGHRIQNGEDMLLFQGARAFEIWTGRKAPLAVMRKALGNALLVR